MVKPSIHYNNHIYRLHSVGKLNLQSMLLCIAIHGSKVPLCLSMVLPYSPVAASVLLPSLFLISPSLLMFLFTFAVGKVIEAPRDMTLNEVNFILCHRVVFYWLTWSFKMKAVLKEWDLCPPFSTQVPLLSSVLLTMPMNCTFAVNSHCLASIVQLLEFLKTLRKKQSRKGLTVIWNSSCCVVLSCEKNVSHKYHSCHYDSKLPGTRVYAVLLISAALNS